LYIKPHGGVTSRLAALAREQPNTLVKVLLDGPYGGLNSKTLQTFDSSLIISGGSRAGLTLPIIQDWMRRMEQERKSETAQEKVVSKSLTVVLSTRHLSTRDWYAEEIASLCAHAPAIVSTSIHVPIYCTLAEGAESISCVRLGSASRSRNSISSGEKVAHSSVDCISPTQFSRPNLSKIVQYETATPGAAVGIVVCGPKSMLNDARNAAADTQLKIMQGRSVAKEVYLHTEPFSR